MRVDVVERFWSKVDKSGECWEWTGLTRGGYGRINISGKKHHAHRVSAMLHFGMFDRRSYVLHHCDNKICVRPEHLYIGDHAQNMKDRTLRGRGRNGNSFKTHCKQGHEFSEENTYIPPSGGRHCRTCRADALRRFHGRN